MAIGHTKWIARAALASALASMAATAALAQDASQAQTPVGQAATAKEKPAPMGFKEIGTALEQARRLPLEERGAVLNGAASSLPYFMKGDLSKDKRAAVRFLSAELSFALGDYRRAGQEYAEAAKEAEKGPYEDDAAMAAVFALEASGKDAEAAKRWKEWEKKYPQSPLRGEAILTRSWNALRQGQNAEAARLLKTLEPRYAWMQSDGRVILARALIAYLEGRPVDALVTLGGAPDTPAAVYLRGLSYEAQGSALKAAAAYQEVADRYPNSSLHDPAMLAKANVFLTSNAYRSAAEEMARVIEKSSREDIRAEAELRRAMALYLHEHSSGVGVPTGDASTAGDTSAASATDGIALLRKVVAEHPKTDVAARAQFFLGEALFAKESYEEAIKEFNKVLADYFEHNLAARAQYRIGRCLDALGRGSEATSTYQAVVAGYPLSPESPAAAYLAGVGLLTQKRPLAAAPYFQLVLDRYAKSDSAGAIVFASSEHKELVEASLCLLEYSYHMSGNLGQLCGVPHLMLQKMPPSTSTWRAYAILIDADALASQARYGEAEAALGKLIGAFPEHPVAVPANRLLAWTYAQQGKDELAIATEEKMLERYASMDEGANLGSAFYNKANILFNRKEYREAADTYDEFTRRFPESPKRAQALYQAGLCYQRLNQNGDAVDRWEELVKSDSTSATAERALVRAGDLYFRAESYADAKRCYRSLLERFSSSSAAAMGLLRIAQCDYNAGHDEEALGGYSEVLAQFPGSPVSKDAARGIELCLYRLGQRKDGGAVLERLVEKYPTSPFAADAQFEIAMRSYEGKRFAEAAEAFRRVVSQFPGYSAADRAHFLMAEAYRQAGSDGDAMLAYEQFVSFFPNSEFRPTVRFRLGSMRFENEQYMEAAVDFTNVVDSQAPKDIAAAALYNLALCKRMIADVEGARRTFDLYRQRYGSSDERGSEIAYQMGDIHDKAGRPDSAAAEFAMALDSKPSPELAVELRYRIGLCAEERKDFDGAIREYRKAIASPEKANAFRLLAVARSAALYEQKGDMAKALESYRDLIKNAKDEALVVAARERASELEAAGKQKVLRGSIGE